MGNLIRDYQDDNDKRDDIVIDVPPPPPQQPINTPQEPYQIPNALNLPAVDPMAAESMGMNESELQGVTADQLPALDLQAPAEAESPVIVPDYSPFQEMDTSGFGSAVEQFQAEGQKREQQSFLKELDNNSLQFLTSGDTFPTLYEGQPSSISALNNQALGLAGQTFEQSKKGQVAETLVPMPTRRVDMSKPDFNSDRSPFWGIPGTIGSIFQNKTFQSFSNFIGMSGASNEFNPLAGVKPYVDSIKKDPWKIVSLPLAPAIITAQAKWGENGDGWFGGMVYGFSLPENIIMGGATDLHNLITGNRDPKSNLPNIAQAVLGGSFDFTQPATAHRPLSGIGSDKAPTTITELKNRSGLTKLILNPWVYDAVRAAKIAVTGNENINIPDLVYQDPSTGKYNTVPAGQALQGAETAASFVIDVIKGGGSDLVVAGLKKFGNVAKTARGVAPPGSIVSTPTPPTPSTPPTTTRIYPTPIQPTPPKPKALPPASTSTPALPEAALDVSAMPPTPGDVQAPTPIFPKPIARIAAPPVKTPRALKNTPALDLPIVPGTVAPKQLGMSVIAPRQLLPSPDIDEVIKEISEAPIGTTVDIDSLVIVERSTEELTEIAKVMGDVPLTRTKPLSRAKLNELAQQYEPDANPYKIHGTPIDIDAFRQTQKAVEVEPGVTAILAEDIVYTPAIDIPTPKDTQSVIQEIAVKRDLIDKTDDVELRQQIAHELDSLTDTLFDVRDIADPAALAETLRHLPDEMRTASKEGVEKLQEVLINERLFDEVSEVEQVLKPQLINAEQALIDNLKAIEELPDVGRGSALKAESFTPSRVDWDSFNAELADDTLQSGFTKKPFVEGAIEGEQDFARDILYKPLNEFSQDTEELLKLGDTRTINEFEWLRRETQEIGREVPDDATAFEKASWMDWARRNLKYQRIENFEAGAEKPIQKFVDALEAKPVAKPVEKLTTGGKSTPLATTNPNAIRRTTNEDRIYNSLQSLETGETALVSKQQIQAKFPNMAPDKLDKSIAKMQEEGLITVDELGMIERVDMDANYDTFYHGTQVRGIDLTKIDPLIGGSRNELGVGIYLTTNKELAEEAARAMPNVNLPPVEAREFDEIGQLFEVTPDVRKPIDATLPPPTSAHEVFMNAVRQSQPDEVFRAVKKRLGKQPSKPFNTYFTTLDEVMAAKLGRVEELDALQTQRLVSDGLRVAGFDSIRDTDILVLLGGSPNNSIGYLEKLADVGNGTVLEGFAARYNIAQRTAAKYPGNKVLEVQAKEAGAQLQTEFLKRSSQMYQESVERAEDVATRLAHSQDDLENHVRSEKKAKMEKRQKAAEIQNENRIKNDSQPDTHHCF